MRVASSYGFNASAVAFGGVIKPPKVKKSKSIRGVGSVALAPAGGISEAFTKRYREDGISFRNALSKVEGVVESDTIFTTTSTVSLEKLDVFGRVKCEAMEAVIKSRRTAGEPDPVFTISAFFEGLCVADADVKTPLNFGLFKQIPTYSRFVEFFSDLENMRKFGKSFGWLKEGEEPDTDMIAAARNDPAALTEPIRCSLLTTNVVKENDETFKQDGYTLIVKGFGKIHLAEVLIKPSLRRINMLRLEVQKPGTDGTTTRKSAAAARGGTGDEYSATYCSGEGNGSNSFPP